MNAPTTTTSLSKDDLKALRQADSISFHHNANGDNIYCTVRKRNAGCFHEGETSYGIAVRASFSGIHGEPKSLTPEGLVCFEMIFSSKWNDDWQTIAGFLKAGDEITLHWSRDGQRNGYCERAVVQGEGPGNGLPLHADALYLKARRGKKTFSFLIAVSLCPDNSARMIRER